MITYPLTPPALPGSRKVEFGLNDNVSLTASPYTGEQQAQQWPAQFFDLTISFPIMDRSEAEPVIAFLAALNGPAGSFVQGDPRAAHPRGCGGAMSPVVDGAHGARTATLATRGWTPSRTGVLLAGDWLQLGTRLHKVLLDANSDAAGKAVLELWPALRDPLADAAAIVLNNTVCIVRLIENRRSWSIDEALMTGDITIKCVEVL